MLKAEAKMEDGVASVDQESNKDVFLESIRETSDEISQMEELRKHAEKMKEDLIRCVIDVLKNYHLELSIPGSSLNMENKADLKSLSLNESGIITYNFADGTVKSQRLEDYVPTELMTVLGSIMPHLKDALKRKRKEYEEVSNRLTKIGKYLGFLKSKITGEAGRAL